MSGKKCLDILGVHRPGSTDGVCVDREAPMGFLLSRYKGFWNHETVEVLQMKYECLLSSDTSVIYIFTAHLKGIKS